jgi:hypothetical protein
VEWQWAWPSPLHWGVLVEDVGCHHPQTVYHSAVLVLSGLKWHDWVLMVLGMDFDPMKVYWLYLESDGDSLQHVVGDRV